MASKKWYVWSPIHHGGPDGEVVIKVGEEVTAESLGVSEEDFAYFVSRGVVRHMPYPDTRSDQSPVEHFREVAAQLAASNYDVDETDELVENLRESDVQTDK